MIVAAILVGLGGMLALGAARAAPRFLPRLNSAEPALAASPPELGYAPPATSRRVVLVIIDGLGLRESFGFSLLDSLRRRGVDAAARAHYPTISRPNWVAVLTGVPPAYSGVRNNWFDFEVTLDSLMDRAAGAGLRASYAADYASGGGRIFFSDFADIHLLQWSDGLARAARLGSRRST